MDGAESSTSSLTRRRRTLKATGDEWIKRAKETVKRPAAVAKAREFVKPPRSRSGASRYTGDGSPRRRRRGEGPGQVPGVAGREPLRASGGEEGHRAARAFAAAEVASEVGRWTSAASWKRARARPGLGGEARERARAGTDENDGRGDRTRSADAREGRAVRQRRDPPRRKPVPVPAPSRTPRCAAFKPPPPTTGRGAIRGARTTNAAASTAARRRPMRVVIRCRSSRCVSERLRALSREADAFKK